MMKAIIEKARQYDAPEIEITILDLEECVCLTDSGKIEEGEDDTI